jgi:hypothetical protein
VRVLSAPLASGTPPLASIPNLRSCWPARNLVVRCWVRAPGAQANAPDVSVYNAWPVSLVARSVADAQRAGVPGAGLSPQPAANDRVADSWHLTATWAFAGINQQPMRDSNSWSVQLGVEV